MPYIVVCAGAVRSLHNNPPAVQEESHVIFYGPFSWKDALVTQSVENVHCEDAHHIVRLEN